MIRHAKNAKNTCGLILRADRSKHPRLPGAFMCLSSRRVLRPAEAASKTDRSLPSPEGSEKGGVKKGTRKPFLDTQRDREVENVPPGTHLRRRTGKIDVREKSQSEICGRRLREDGR